MSETFEVVVRRTFPVPPEEAWRAWSESDLVKQWWGPDGFTCPMADVDLRVGGRTFVAMRAPAEFGGGDLYSTWNFTDVVPHSRIAYVFN
ncbi:MAG TPA: SRPBCC domain-containing protein, partial [Propionibacteriaceae bacterium]